MRDKLDNARAKQLLQEFREAVGNDPIEAEIRRKERDRARESYRDSVENRQAKERCLSGLSRRFLSLATDNSHTPGSEDLVLVLDGGLPFFDVMKAKIDAIVRYGNINFSVRAGS